MVRQGTLGVSRPRPQVEGIKAHREARAWEVTPATGESCFVFPGHAQSQGFMLNEVGGLLSTSAQVWKQFVIGRLMANKHTV